MIYKPYPRFLTKKNIKAARITVRITARKMMPRAIAITIITGEGTALFPTEVEFTSLFLKRKQYIKKSIRNFKDIRH